MSKALAKAFPEAPSEICPVREDECAKKREPACGRLQIDFLGMKSQAKTFQQEFSNFLDTVEEKRSFGMDQHHVIDIATIVTYLQFALYKLT